MEYDREHKGNLQEPPICNQRLKVVLNQFQTVLWDWDFEGECIYVMDNSTQEADGNCNANDFLAALAAHAEDTVEFAQWLKLVRWGANPTTITLRMLKYGTAEWTEFASTPVVENGAVVRAIVVARNVTAEHEETEKLRREALSDALSGLYNKQSCSRIARDFLNESCCAQTHALFVIDLDDFKAINDTYGHLVGDKVIEKTGCALQGLFRGTDIVGRVGGDEFMVLMCDCTESTARKKAAEICKMFNPVELLCKNNALSPVSVGIAMWPRAGIVFEDLYAQADAAMYLSKAKGKSSYTIVNEPSKSE